MSTPDTTANVDALMWRNAVFSRCETYRYTLERRWSRGPLLLWVLLNPSTANAQVDDPTNRRGISFSIKWGYAGCVFVNLFAYRTPIPHLMKRADDPIGPDNNFHLRDQAGKCQDIIVAWGTHGAHHGRDSEVIGLLSEHSLSCLGITKHGFPKHPLYLSKNTERIDFAGNGHD